MRAASPTGRARSRSASTAGPSPTAPISESTSRPSSTGWSASVRATAAGTAREPTARSARRSTARSTCWKGSWSMREPPAARPNPEEARRSGEEYLLKRNLFRRLGTGEPADERFLQFLHPNRWRYDVLRALDYFRSCRDSHRRRSRSAARRGYRPRAFQTPGGRTMAPRLEPGRGGCGSRSTTRPASPARWVTLRAMRVLTWWEKSAREAVSPRAARILRYLERPSQAARGWGIPDRLGRPFAIEHVLVSSLVRHRARGREN